MKNLIKPLPWLIVLPVLSGCGVLYDYFGGNFRGAPHEMEANISDGAKGLIRKAFEGTSLIADYHVHVAANGKGDRCRGAYLHPDLHSWRHPLLMVKTRILMSASGVSDYDKADEQYADRLEALLVHFQNVQDTQSAIHKKPIKSRFYIYALDHYYDGGGEINLDRTDLHVPNDCVIRMSARFNRKLSRTGTGASVEVVPVASVHPYRGDFKQQVVRLARSGIRFMKWLPPSMNIDMSKVEPSHYEALADAGMTLLVHTGDEHTLRVYDDNQFLGDPILLSHALEKGVTAVALHMAREGRPSPNDDSYFERFIAMMEKEEYKGLLWGELSAITMDKTPLTDSSQPLIPPIIKGIHHGLLRGRIRNGSDYPLTGVSYLNPTRGLARRGMITRDEKKWLDEIYAYNPLLFDFVTKRTLKHPDGGESLPPGVFE